MHHGNFFKRMFNPFEKEGSSKLITPIIIIIIEIKLYTSLLILRFIKLIKKLLRSFCISLGKVFETFL